LLPWTSEQTSRFVSDLGEQLQKQLDVHGTVYGNESVSCAFLFKWFRQFRVGHEDIEVDLRSG